MKKYLIPLMIIIGFSYNADAAVKVKNNTANRYQESFDGYEIKGGEGEIDDSEAIAILENDIRILDEEIAKCKKQKKGWIAATVIGAAGVVATGTAAAVQGVKISDKKTDLQDKQAELKDKKAELAEIKKQNNDAK